MIDSDILSPNKMLPDIIIIDTFQYLPNIFHLNAINSSIPESPNTYEEAIQRTDTYKWIEIMKIQYSIPIKNKIWKQMNRDFILKRHRIYTGRWIYIYKRNGTYKAH
jgi:hypothetical protein